MEQIKLNEDQIKSINTAISNGIAYQRFAWENQDTMSAADTTAFRTEYERLLAIMRGTYWQQRNSYQESKVLPRRSSNQILPKLVTKHSLMTSGHTEFNCEPLDEQYDNELADQSAALLTSDWQRFNYDDVCNRSLWDINAYKYGVIEVGWRFYRDSERLEGERGEPAIPADAMPMLINNQIMPPSMQEYESEAEAEQAAQKSQKQEEELIWGDVEVDDHFIERVRPTHLLIDPNCTNFKLTDARYAFRIKYEYADKLKKNKNYKNTKDLKGTVYIVRDDINDEYKSRPAGLQEQGEPLVKIYDGYMFFDRNNDGIDEMYHVVMSDEHNDPLLVTQSPYVDDDGRPAFLKATGNPYPFRIIPGIIVDNDTFYPESPVYQAENLQKAYDESWSSLNDRRTMSTIMYTTQDGALTPEVIKKIESGVDRLVIELENKAEFNLVDQPSGTLDMYKSLEAEPQEISRQLGINDFQESVLPKKDMLAREVNALQESGGVRTAGDSEKFNAFKEDIATCILILMQMFADKGRNYNQTDTEGKRQWGTLRNIDLRGQDERGNLLPVGIQYKVKVNADSVMPQNKSYELQLAMQLLKECAPFMQVPDEWTGQPLVNVKSILRDLFKAAGKKDVDAYVEPEPNDEEKAQIMQQKQAQSVAAKAAGQGDPQQLMQALQLIDSYTPEQVQQVLAQMQGGGADNGQVQEQTQGQNG